MSQLTINTGDADKGNGDPLRTAFTKVNSNFTELYTTTNLSAIDQHVIPVTTETYDLGSSTNRWRSLYVSENTVYFGDKALTINQAGGIEVDGVVVGGQADTINGVLDQDVNVTVNSVPTVTATTTAGTDPYTGQFELSELSLNLYEVQAGWEMNTGTEQSPIWTTVTNASPNPGEYWIYLASGFEFQFSPSTAYAFRSPTQVQQTWTFDTTGNLTLPGSLKVSNAPEGSIVGEGGVSINAKNGYQFSAAYQRAEILNPTPGYNANVAGFYLDGNGATIEVNTDDTGNSWRFDTTGNLTTPGDIQLGADGYLRFSDSSFQGTAFVGDATRLYGNVDTDINVTVQHRLTVSAEAGAGSAGQTMVVDTTFNDDITVVQAGWEINAGSEQAPIWLPVLVTTAEPTQYSIPVLGFDFQVGTTYTFRNPTATVQSWTFNDTGELTTPGLGTISHQNNDLKLEVSGTDVIVLRTGGGDTVVTSDGDLQLGGNIITQGIVELTNIGAVTAYTPGIDMFVALQGFINNGVALRATDSQLVSKDWLFSVDSSITFPDATVQTTAWAGGRVVAVPTHSTGAVDDLQGDLAFNSTHLYYCTADYNQLGHQVTVATAYDGDTEVNTNMFQLTKTADTLQITAGDIISDGDGGATSTVVSVSSNENYTYVSTGSFAYAAIFPLTFTSTDYVAGGNIWKRVSWSADTW